MESQQLKSTSCFQRHLDSGLPLLVKWLGQTHSRFPSVPAN
jgi:hypothetical protein